MKTAGHVGPTGSLGLRVTRGGTITEEILDTRLLDAPPAHPLSFSEILYYGAPRPELPAHVNRWRRSNLPNLWRGARRVLGSRLVKAAHVYGQLYLRAYRGDGSVDEYGLASMRVVTTTGVGFIVDAFQNLTELEAMNFHGFGTGGAAEAVGNTALTTELTTQYATDNVRPTGTQSEAAANIYRTVGTLDPDADVAITEHGIFSQAATGGGVLLDRSLFSVINLVGATGDTLAATYDFTVTSGG